MGDIDLPRWRAATDADHQALLDRLLPEEWTCVPFTAHLASRDYGTISIQLQGGRVRQALMLTTQGLLLPVLDPTSPSIPPEMPGQVPPQLTVMGAEPGVLAVERALGRQPSRSVTYHLMKVELSKVGPEGFLEPAPAAGLHVRRATAFDLRKLYPLQRDYEKEEVLLDPSQYVPRLCRAHLKRALREQIVYLAEEEGGAVAKAGTNARGIGFDQIGGVFTVRERRNRGIGAAVMRALLTEILSAKRGACLFVKKANEPAIALYRRLGFSVVGGYRISYYVG